MSTAARAPERTGQPDPTVADRSNSSIGDYPAVARGLCKTFRRESGATVAALDNINCEVRHSEVVVLLGPSGCGKTTLLRCVAGLETPDTGEITLGGRVVFDGNGVEVPPERRRLSMIFQSYALWPHMTVFKNVAYPLTSRRVPRREIARRVHEVLEMVGIAELASQYPGQMSGGQQQRTALARALVSGDSLLLFDEPLSNVDARVREHLRVELLAMQKRIGFSALYVTHDQLEAMELADRIAVMRAGRIEQVGTPHEIYTKPTSRYVAEFVGTANSLDGTISRYESGTAVFESSLGRVISTDVADGLAVGMAGAVIMRPENWRVATTPQDGPNSWSGVVSATLFAGDHTDLVVQVAGERLRVRVQDSSYAVGDQVWLSVEPAKARVVADDAPGPNGTVT